MKIYSLLAILLIFCLGKLAKATYKETVDGYLIGNEIRLESKIFPKRYIRHRTDMRIYLDKWDDGNVYNLHTSFHVVPGLYGIGVSFRSVDYPEYFIAHSGGRSFQIRKFQDNYNFKKDVSWIAHEGLKNSKRNQPRDISFEPVNQPGKFMRALDTYYLQNDRRDGTEPFRESATWMVHILKQRKTGGEWKLVYGNNNARASGIWRQEVERGVTIGQSESTTIKRQYSWKVGGSASYVLIRSMFEASAMHSVSMTSTNTWQQVFKEKNTYEIKLQHGWAIYLWQWNLYAFGSDGTYVTVETKIFRQTHQYQSPRSLEPSAQHGQKPLNSNGYLIGKRIRLESKSSPERFIRYKSNYQLSVDRWDTNGIYDLETSYDVVPGLSGIGVSFRAVNHPEYFLRLRSNSFILERFQNNDQFKQDTSWIAHEGFVDGKRDNPRSMSFESVNNPGKYMTITKVFLLELRHRDGTDWFEKDATWVIRVLKDRETKGEWRLVYGNDNSRASGTWSQVIEKGVTVGKSQEQTVTNQYSWKIGGEESYFLIRSMFETSAMKSVSKTTSSTWRRSHKVKHTYELTMHRGHPVYLWQWVLYAIGSDGSYVSVRTNIFSQTHDYRKPRPLQ